MLLRFTKMHGLGNDFMVIDATRAPVHLSAEQIRALADRHFGVGFDQLLMVEPAQTPGIDFRYRIFNADGGEVEQCGNGARCFARFVYDKGLTAQKTISVETQGGMISPKIENNGSVTVDMGVPVLEAKRIPFLTASQAIIQKLELPNNQQVDITALSMGNPHAVQVVKDVDLAPVKTQGPLIENHAAFPARVNAGFMQIVDTHTIRLRVYERGAGETQACGTGACAAVVAGILRAQLASPVRVETRGGVLTVAWAGPGRPVLMTGPAKSVFEGQIEI